MLTYAISVVWVINGLWCKVLNQVPRHQQIVARILGEEHSAVVTRTIGFAEIGMTIWILSGISTRFCAVAQILLIAAMNTIEIILAPDLLLFGKGNGLLALLLTAIIFYNWLLPMKKITSNT
jgi:hypothetical protein